MSLRYVDSVVRGRGAPHINDAHELQRAIGPRALSSCVINRPFLMVRKPCCGLGLSCTTPSPR